MSANFEDCMGYLRNQITGCQSILPQLDDRTKLKLDSAIINIPLNPEKASWEQIFLSGIMVGMQFAKNQQEDWS